MDGPQVIVSPMVRRSLLAQPVLCLRAVWDPADPESGAGRDLAVIRQVREEQGLEQAGPPYICVGEADEGGLVEGEVAVPVDRLGTPVGQVESMVQAATDAVSVVYRDDIHLSAGQAVVQHLVEKTLEAGLVRVGLPRWIYHTSPAWNLLPDDHLIEVLWPVEGS